MRRVNQIKLVRDAVVIHMRVLHELLYLNTLHYHLKRQTRGRSTAEATDAMKLVISPYERLFLNQLFF